MSFYFRLQFRLLNRHIQDFGLSPLWGWLLGATGFFLFSWLLFSKTSFALYLYLLLAASWLLQLSNRKRADFLKVIFPAYTLRSIRMTENLIVVAPFVLFLLYRQYFLAALLLLPASLVLSFFHYSAVIRSAIPTPFGKKPFEFVTGFRQSLLFFLAAYLLAGIGIFVDNFHLCLFACGVNFLLILSFYTRPEPLFYLWSFAFTPAGFLKEKIKTALLHTTFLTFIPLAALLIAYPGKWWLIAGIQLLGYLYIIQVILVKYTAYPGEIPVIQTLIFLGSIFFPPLLLGLIPFFYSRSVNRLATYLT
ncbi:hypothetical protein [Niabella drilacis]|uniref:Uncharacterized protein n=1 Tax=Niabella drilacis (strain DSM 25811 / CCM 8410 / CCUG 62505 / LMG 26954 / E90) TaxID=1285928 RepID=A0A1G6KPS0_NIADE|nr:hypothetical protein [Niabella drilacis]SDC33112.1 hypothetical protein SAMN04487894_10259 [Niabella drilacis]